MVNYRENYRFMGRVIAAQQCVQRTAGTLRDLQAFFSLRVFSAIRLLSPPAPCPPLTRAVRLFPRVKAKIR